MKHEELFGDVRAGEILHHCSRLKTLAENHEGGFLLEVVGAVDGILHEFEVYLEGSLFS